MEGLRAEGVRAAVLVLHQKGVKEPFSSPRASSHVPSDQLPNS